jgi:hypothetical protein
MFVPQTLGNRFVIVPGTTMFKTVNTTTVFTVPKYSVLVFDLYGAGGCGFNWYGSGPQGISGGGGAFLRVTYYVQDSILREGDKLNVYVGSPSSTTSPTGLTPTSSTVTALTVASGQFKTLTAGWGENGFHNPPSGRPYGGTPFIDGVAYIWGPSTVFPKGVIWHSGGNGLNCASSPFLSAGAGCAGPDSNGGPGFGNVVDVSGKGGGGYASDGYRWDSSLGGFYVTYGGNVGHPVGSGGGAKGGVGSSGSGGGLVVVSWS